MKKVRLAQDMLYGEAENTVNVIVNGYVYIEGTVSFLNAYEIIMGAMEVEVEKNGEWVKTVCITGQKNDTNLFYLPIAYLRSGDVIRIWIPNHSNIAYEVYAEVDELS